MPNDMHIGDVGFDPIGFSSFIPLDFLREAELKHGRICQLAVVGFAATDLGMRLPGDIHQVYELFIVFVANKSGDAHSAVVVCRTAANFVVSVVEHIVSPLVARIRCVDVNTGTLEFSRAFAAVNFTRPLYCLAVVTVCMYRDLTICSNKYNGHTTAARNTKRGR